MSSRTTIPQDSVGRSGTIVIVDQDGFTKTILERGAAAALAKIWKIRKLLIPIFRSRGGEVYKVDADNLYVYFRNVNDALAASLEAHETLERESRRARLREPLGVSIGIGCGAFIYLPSEDDYYGAEVNLASKLGEDVADGGQTLLSKAAAESVRSGAPGTAGAWRTCSMSGVTIEYREWLGG